jgi:hypothetical protein
MKQQVSPAVATALIIVIALIAGFFVWRGANPASREGEKPPGMPPSVAAEFQKRLGGVTPAGGQVSRGTTPAGGYIAPPPQGSGQ